ncbi:DNA-directed DNA polymerase [Methanocaldococcus vulcanius M7]|uniref:DNA polymerase n=1 Tax=Methanocaldococcus vulcanius (strain ATCC 700851 / DSM 12094 / M7) TaxID=579137 RepID=C9REF3_METVM|nr:DNA polymerase domain-containing protein [Methanocaldococcus vulcanius]ACX71955.1 DNA-directed DNA polymerase [Methanocaldococcus vulcanius M7]
MKEKAPKIDALIDCTYKTEDNRAVIYLYLLENILKDREFSPYFYVEMLKDRIEKEDIDKIKEFLLKEDLLKFVENLEVVNKTILKKEKEIVKIIATHPQRVPKLRKIKECDIVKEIYEHDIPFAKRYLIDSDIVPMTYWDFENRKQVSIEIPKLKTVSFDMEVYNRDTEPDPEKDPILMASFWDDNGGKVITYKHFDHSNIEVVNSEKDLIKKIVEMLRQYDVIFTYNGDNFDFPYLKARAKIYGIDIKLGRDGEELKIKRGGMEFRSYIPGRVHIDLYPISRRLLKLTKYTLEDVVYNLFGIEKLKIPHTKIVDYWANNDKILIEYSLQDAKYTHKIGKYFFPLEVMFSRIVNQTPFEITRMSSGQMVEYLLMKNAFKENMIVPNKPDEKEYRKRLLTSYEGGYVKEPEKGMFEDIISMDFRCHPRGTKVIVKNNGLTDIENVKVGDYVLGIDGWQKVKRVWKYPYNGFLVNVNGLKSTPNHKIPVIKKENGKDRVIDVSSIYLLNLKGCKILKIKNFESIGMFGKIFKKDTKIKKVKGLLEKIAYIDPREGLVIKVKNEKEDIFKTVIPILKELNILYKQVDEKTIIIDSIDGLLKYIVTIGFNDKNEEKIKEIIKEKSFLEFKELEDIKISIEEYEGYVYDLTLEGRPYYFANGILTHNSLYPSIIIAYNISPETLDCECCKDISEKILGHWFCKKREGLIPKTLRGLIERRINIKNKMKKMESEKEINEEYNLLDYEQRSLKILANSILPDEYLTVIEDDGVKIVKIGEYINRLMEKYPNKIKLSEVLEVKNLKTFSFNKLTKKCEIKKVKGLIRHKYEGKAYKIKLRSGRTIRVTEGHSLFKYENGEIVEVKGNEIKINDLIVVPRKIAHINKKIVINIPKRLVDADEEDIKNLVITKHKDKIHFIKLKKTLEDIERNKFNVIFDDCILYLKKLGLIDYNIIKAINKVEIKILDKKKFKIYKKYIDTIIEHGNFARGRSNIQYLKIKDLINDIPDEEFEDCEIGALCGKINALLKLDENLAKFLGYFVTRGGLNKYKAKEGTTHEVAIFKSLPDYQKEIVKIFKKTFGAGCISKDKVIMDNKIVYLILKYIFKCGNKNKKHIPEEIFLADEKVIKSFLDGFLKAKKNSHKGTTTFMAKDEDYLNQLMILFNLVGIPTRFTPVKNKGYKLTLNPNYKLINDLMLDEVKEIEEFNYNGYVYDLSVEDNENFLVNNIYAHNSVYGYLAFPRARFYSRECAEVITYLGRKYILETIEEAEKFGFKVIYADSVVKDAKVIIKEDGKIKEIKIEDLFKKVDYTIGDKEYCILNNVETLTIEDTKLVWRKVPYIMRHRTNKKIYRVKVKDRYVDITEDHSIIGVKNNKLVELKPTEIKDDETKLIILNKDLKSYNFASVEEINCIKYSDYVYDIEVENTHRFFANGILVHNTDGFYAVWKEKISKDDLIKKALEFVKYINSKLPGTMELEFEGYFKRGIFITKKRYALIDENGRVIVKGLEFVRRDWSNLARITQRRVLEALLLEGDINKAKKAIQDVIKDLREKKIKKEDLIIYTQLTKNPNEYKTTAPHVEIAKKMMREGKKIKIGDVIGYIIVKGSKSISERAKLPEEVSIEEIDVNYYIDNQILPPVLRIMEAVGVSKNELKKEGTQLTLDRFLK